MAAGSATIGLRADSILRTDSRQMRPGVASKPGYGARKKAVRRRRTRNHSGKPFATVIDRPLVVMMVIKSARPEIELLRAFH
jgi:hypothetical protein